MALCQIQKNENHQKSLQKKKKSSLKYIYEQNIYKYIRIYFHFFILF